MAMIECPNCGGEVSDKAKKCVHCGSDLVPNEKKCCLECGAELAEEDTICSKCGCPVVDMSKNDNLPQQVEVTGVKVAERVKKIAAAAAVLLLIAALVGGLAMIMQKKREAAAEAQREKTYAANFEHVLSAMETGGIKAESCGKLEKIVWFNAIYEESDIQTDPYVCPNGRFVSDFNEAMINLFVDEDFKKRIEDIEKIEKNVSEKMKLLQNPPEAYEDAYDAVLDLYQAYIALTNLVVSPSGNLQQFSENVTNAAADFDKYFGNMKIYRQE